MHNYKLPTNSEDRNHVAQKKNLTNKTRRAQNPVFEKQRLCKQYTRKEEKNRATARFFLALFTARLTPLSDTTSDGLCGA